MNDEVKALLAAAESAEKRCQRYSRWAALLDSVSFVLYVSAGATFGASLADYLLHGGGYTLLVAGLALWASAAVARILHDVYGRNAAKAAEQACTFRSVAEVIAEIEKVKTWLKEAADRLEQELERRRLERIHAN
ncbi:MAG: hypothetical protein ACO2PM_13180 [Pyrobaculum sp.]